MRVEGPSGALVDRDLPGAQGRLARAALVVERRPLARDQLAEVLWGERLPRRWTSALHALVSKLRSSLTSVGLSHPVSSGILRRPLLAGIDNEWAEHQRWRISMA